jgi:hypothetical protein
VSASFNAGDLFTLVITAANTVRIEGVVPATIQSATDTTRIDVASGATVDLSTLAPNTRNINITGTTNITGFTIAVGQLYFVRFNAALTLTNNASIVTQTGANITTAAGDTCILRATAANTVEVLCYARTIAAPGSAPLYACRAWVNFNGTGTVAIRGSGNVSSITDNGVGNYTVNFTTAMQDANYATQVTITNVSTSASCVHQISNQLTGSVSLTNYENGALTDNSQICVTVHR